MNRPSDFVRIICVFSNKIGRYFLHFDQSFDKKKKMKVDSLPLPPFFIEKNCFIKLER